MKFTFEIISSLTQKIFLSLLMNNFCTWCLDYYDFFLWSVAIWMSSGRMIYLYFARTFFIRGFGATPLIKLWYVLAEILKDFFLCFSISFGFEWFSTHKRTLWWETIKWLFFRFKKCFLDIGLLQHPRWRESQSTSSWMLQQL